MCGADYFDKCAMDDVTLFSLFQEILTELGVKREVLQKYEIWYKILNKAVLLLIGVISIVNTTLAFTNENTILKQILLCVNMLFVSGLLGNFGGQHAATKAEKDNLDHMITSLHASKNKLGLPLAPPPAILDTVFMSPPVLIYQGGVLGERIGLQVSGLAKDPHLRARIMTLEHMVAVKMGR